MANKVIIGILVLLVIFMGGVGYYSYTLSQRIDDLGPQIDDLGLQIGDLGQQIGDLGERLTTFEMEQIARVDSVSGELSNLRVETLDGLSSLQGQIEESLAEIDTLEGKLEVTGERISSVEDEIGGVTSQIQNLDERIAGTEARAGSMLDASEVYQRISQATVRISNGRGTIGSGIILDNEGHVITANHVVEGLSQIYVILHDGRILEATAIGGCRFSDIAVLELEYNPSIEPPPLADSGQIKIGEPVVALGSPFDLRDTITAGIISQINRYAEIEYEAGNLAIPNLLQFDAPVNPGNSGCPLANAGGEIIGIVIARIFPTEGDGICYAVASNKVRRVTEAIIANGSFDYPWIGVGIADLTPQMVEDMSLETANGVFVGNVVNGSPADTAGIEVGDIIVAIDGVQVRDSGEITSYLGEFKSPGDTAIITLLRDGDEIELLIVVGTRE